MRALPALAHAYATAAPPKPVPLAKLKDSFLDGTSSTYLEQLQERFNENPESVDKTWASFFRSLGAAFAEGFSDTHMLFNLRCCAVKDARWKPDLNVF